MYLKGLKQKILDKFRQNRYSLLRYIVFLAAFKNYSENGNVELLDHPWMPSNYDTEF